MNLLRVNDRRGIMPLSLAKTKESQLNGINGRRPSASKSNIHTKRNRLESNCFESSIFF